MKRKRIKSRPDINRTTLYAIIVNAIQIVVLIVFVLRVMLTDLAVSGGFSLQVIVLVGAGMACWGACIDIQEAIQTRKRVRTITELQTTNEQMDALNLKLRAQRHDFLNHVQVIYSLLEMQEYEEATDYLETIYEELRSVSKVMRTHMTAFNALLQVKNTACEENGISLVMDIRSTLDNMPIPSWEVCCIIGNLLDNAVDALSDEDHPQIVLSVMEDIKGFQFDITNNGAGIPEDIQETIFDAGVSTKGDGRGMGLSIVRSILSGYASTISLESVDGKTTFTLKIPKGATEGSSAVSQKG